MIDYNIVEKLRLHSLTVEPVRGARIAAGIVHKKRLVVTESNLLKTHTFQYMYSSNEHAIWWHAETRAIWKGLQEDYPLKDCLLYVIRTTNDEQLALAKPCKGCRKAIESFDLKKTFYSNKNGIDELI